MYLKLNGIEMSCAGTERWGDLLERLPDGGAGALGISVRGRTDSLNDTLGKGGERLTTPSEEFYLWVSWHVLKDTGRGKFGKLRITKVKVLSNV